MEIVVSIVVLAVALLPIVHMITSGRRTVALTEYHILAQFRARRVIELFSSYPYEAMLNLTHDEHGNLKAHLISTESGFPADLQENINRYDEFVTFEELAPGLGLLTVTISWTPGSGERREYRLQRIFSDESATLADTWPLRQVGGRG